MVVSAVVGVSAGVSAGVSVSVESDWECVRISNKATEWIVWDKREKQNTGAEWKSRIQEQNTGAEYRKNQWEKQAIVTKQQNN